MNSGDLRDWLSARRALLTRSPIEGGHLVTIFCMDNPNDAVEVVSQDFERAVMIAQYAFDMPLRGRIELALTMKGDTAKC